MRSRITTAMLASLGPLLVGLAAPAAAQWHDASQQSYGWKDDRGWMIVPGTIAVRTIATGATRVGTIVRPAGSMSRAVTIRASMTSAAPTRTGTAVTMAAGAGAATVAPAR